MPTPLTSPLQMVDLQGQYEAIKSDVDAAMQAVIDDSTFINGPAVNQFTAALATYLEGTYALGVGNGTDALQIAMMALGIGPGDEVITTAFTFIATAEAAALLGATPVFADIDPLTYNLDPDTVEALITERTRAIVPVHLFGQPADLSPLQDIARRHGIPLIEDNAQGIGSTYKGQKTGYIGDIGTLSFFPSKNLGCYGDGGAVLTNDADLFERMRRVANHGSIQKYHNEIVGINSRLDAIQAAILGVKLTHLDDYIAARRAAADRYDALFRDAAGVTVPYRAPERLHVFHQYTLRVDGGRRDALADYLAAHEIPHAVYYPVPLHRLPVFDEHVPMRHGSLKETERAAAEVISLPMHTELTEEHQARVADAVLDFLKR